MRALLCTMFMFAAIFSVVAGRLIESLLCIIAIELMFIEHNTR